MNQVRVDQVRTQAPADVSVIVPIYRVEDTVEACLASLAAQTQSVTEVVLVDDCGGDRSMERALAAAAQWELLITVVEHPANRGLGAARNSGLAVAKGQYIAFLDSDDRFDPQFVELMMEGLLATEAELAICRTVRVDQDDQELGTDEPVYARRICSGVEYARKLLRNEVRAYAGNKLYRAEALSLPMFDVGRAYEDFVPALRLGLRCRRVVFCNQGLYRYTWSPESISNGFGAHTMDLLQIADEVTELIELLDDHDQWSADVLVHRYRQVILPLANMATRAEQASGRSTMSRQALERARGLIRAEDVPALVRAGATREAVATAVLRVSRRLYSLALRVR